MEFDSKYEVKWLAVVVVALIALLHCTYGVIAWIEGCPAQPILPPATFSKQLK